MKWVQLLFLFFSFQRKKMRKLLQSTLNIIDHYYYSWDKTIFHFVPNRYDSRVIYELKIIFHIAKMESLLNHKIGSTRVFLSWNARLFILERVSLNTARPETHSTNAFKFLRAIAWQGCLNTHFRTSELARMFQDILVWIDKRRVYRFRFITGTHGVS